MSESYWVPMRDSGYIQHLLKTKPSPLHVSKLRKLFITHKYLRSQVFRGNYDRFVIITNKFSRPITARYIRIHPMTWKGYIAMRVEFYGCIVGNVFRYFIKKSKIMNLCCIYLFTYLLTMYLLRDWLTFVLIYLRSYLVTYLLTY